jgi:DUF4097 and DUF4098 domain-containing protein YvlB
MLILLVAALAAQTPPAPPAGPQPPAAASERQAPQTDRTVSVQKGARLTLENEAGEIIVRGWDRNEIRVQARHAPRESIRIRNTPAAVMIEAESERFVTGAVDYELTVPRWMPLELEGMATYIQVDELQADVSAETVRGDIVIRDVSGVIRASTVEGELTIERVAGRVDASSVNRGVTITDATAEIMAESVSGGVRLNNIRSRAVDASALSGGVTFSGEFQPEGIYRLLTHSGGIAITTPSLDATLSVRMFSGRFDSAFPTKQAGTPRRGQAVTHVAGSGRTRITLETFSGSIRIRRP